MARMPLQRDVKDVDEVVEHGTAGEISRGVSYYMPPPREMTGRHAEEADRREALRPAQAGRGRGVVLGLMVGVALGLLWRR